MFNTKKISEYSFEFFNARFFKLLFSYGVFLFLFLAFVSKTAELSFILSLDHSIFYFITSLREPALTGFMEFISFFGNLEIILPLALAVVLYLFLRKRYDLMLALFASSGLAGIVTISVKNFFERHRPPAEDALVYASGFSFPSGHAMISIVFYGMLAYFVFISSKNKVEKLLSFVIGLLFVVLLPFSRVYLGVHWPSDVVGSLILGSIWFLMIRYILNEFRSSK